MNKLLVALLALTVVGSASAYTMRITNKTDETINVIATYSACGRSNFNVEPGQTYDEGMMACCARSMQITGQESGARLEPNLMEDYGTGAGIVCRSINYVITKNKRNGNLTAQTSSNW